MHSVERVHLRFKQIQPEPERWAFSDTELEHPELCSRNDELVASIFPEDATEYVLVIVYRNGSATYRYMDCRRRRCITGVVKRDRELAEEEETLDHPIYHRMPLAAVDEQERPSWWNHSVEWENTAVWRNVEAYPNGRFKRFV